MKNVLKNPEKLLNRQPEIGGRGFHTHIPKQLAALPAGNDDPDNESKLFRQFPHFPEKCHCKS